MAWYPGVKKKPDFPVGLGIQRLKTARDLRSQISFACALTLCGKALKSSVHLLHDRGPPLMAMLRKTGVNRYILCNDHVTSG